MTEQGGGLEGEFVRATDHFRKWLRDGLTACAFAGRIAGSAGGIAFLAMGDPVAPPIDLFFDEAARRGRVAIVLMPRVNSEAQIVASLERFQRESARWAVARREVEGADGIAIGVEWRTANDEITEVMGFGPFPKMPVTRRAPYAAIAVWPGPHRNPCKAQRKPGRVSFVNAAHEVDCVKYEAMFRHTDKSVNDLLGEDGLRSKPYRQVAFVVDEAAFTAG